MRYIFEVSSRAVAGREDEYNDWYSGTHIHEVLALPGFLSCERFKRNPVDGSPADFVALYEVEADDPILLFQSLIAAGPTMNLSDSLDQSSARFEILHPIGDKIVSNN